MHLSYGMMPVQRPGKAVSTTGVCRYKRPGSAGRWWSWCRYNDWGRPYRLPGYAGTTSRECRFDDGHDAGTTSRECRFEDGHDAGTTTGECHFIDRGVLPYGQAQGYWLGVFPDCQNSGKPYHTAQCERSGNGTIWYTVLPVCGTYITSLNTAIWQCQDTHIRTSVRDVHPKDQGSLTNNQTYLEQKL
jgi:hypothetical protein